MSATEERQVGGGTLWFKQLFRGIADESEADDCNRYRPRGRTSSSKSSVAPDDGSELLEDFPSKPRRPKRTSGVSDISSMTEELTLEGDSLNDSEESEEDSEVDRDSKPAAAATAAATKTPLIPSSLQGPSKSNWKQSACRLEVPVPFSRCRAKKSVRIVLENSTIQTYEKYVTSGRDIARLFYSKMERLLFTKQALAMAKIIRHALRDYHESAAVAAITAASNEKEELTEMIASMLPSPSVLQEALHNQGHTDIDSEEIIGIEHLVSQKQLIVALNSLKMQHSKTVVEHDRQTRHAREFRGNLHGYGSRYSLNDAAERSAKVEQLALAQISKRYSDISMQIAQTRAAYVAEMED